MIYLIQDCYKDENGNVVDILKIGYSSKPFKESRENQYKTHNYGFKLLQEREGDTELENYLHKRFSKYLLPDSYEWFYYNEEIINNFNVIQNIIVTTKEEYIENIKYYLLRNLESPENLYKIHKNNIIGELQNYPEYNKEEKNIYKQRIKEIFELGYSIIKENIEKDCILSNPFFNDVPEEIEKDWLEGNPWKNYAELYYEMNTIKKSKEDFDKYIENKTKKTESLLSVYNLANLSERHSLSEVYQRGVLSGKYRNNFITVDEHAGSDLVPIFNKLVMIAEMRAFEIQQVDYKDRFSVFSALYREVSEIDDVNKELDTIYSMTYLQDKYKYLCSLSESMVLSLLPHLPESFNNYYTVLGLEKMKALGYNATDMKKAYEGIIGNQGVDIGKYIVDGFKVGEIYSKAEVKKKLGEIYKEHNYMKTPRAIDIGDYFIIKNCMIRNKETGKRDASYEIIEIKDKGD